MISIRQMMLAICTATLLGAGSRAALACACCTSTGERTDLVMKLEKSHVEELERLKFDSTAVLFLGEAEPDTVKGITKAADKYELQASWQKDRFVFSFRDQLGNNGTLSLARPRTYSTFGVDPRTGTPPPSRGPVLYKEWRLTSKAAGTGIFVPSMGANQTLTLVLQGGGNNCTSANDFTHWMLVMWGPKAKYHFFGDLVTR